MSRSNITSRFQNNQDWLQNKNRAKGPHKLFTTQHQMLSGGNHDEYYVVDPNSKRIYNSVILK